MTERGTAATTQLGGSEVIHLYEHRLLARHVEGDREAFAELLRRYRSPVYGYLVRCGVPPCTRDDLCQEVFLAVHNAAARYKPTHALRVWIFTIVANTVRSYFRRVATYGRVFDPSVSLEAVSRDGDSQAFAEAHETEAWINEVLSALPLVQREIWYLRCVQRLEHAEIASVLGLMLSTVKTHLRRGRLVLAKALVRRQACVRREAAT